MKDFELSVNPVETYEAPQIPILGDNNPALLKKLPSRWQKNVKVIAGLGLAGIFALSGCANELTEPHTSGIVHNLGLGQDSYNGYSEAELLVRLHSGGSLSSFYVVHLTEQEAFGIIRARLEAAGLNFDATPPEYTINSWLGTFGLDLFDEKKGVAITQFVWVESLAAQVEEAFAEQTSDIIVGTFYNPGRSAGSGDAWRPQRPSDEELEELRPIFRRQLISQADVFIARLQSEGILERFSDIGITINETPVSFGEYPVIVNNHKMVPAIEIFKLLGMEVNLDDGSWAITATKDDITIRIGARRLWVNDGWADADIPVFTHNDRVLVPLQFVAETVGANVEWDEEARMFTVTTP